MKILMEIEGEISIYEFLEELIVAHHQSKYGEKCVIEYLDIHNSKSA